MIITHTTPDEAIQAMQRRIDALQAELQQVRADNNTLTALALKLPTTDLAPYEIAQALIAGCPGWLEVTGHLFFARIMLDAPPVKQHSCELSEGKQ